MSAAETARPSEQPMPLLALAVLVGFMDEVRKATSMVDVNIAAGSAMTELLNLPGDGAEKAGQLVNFPLQAVKALLL